MAQKDNRGDRALRLITILGWIPAFALLLPYGIESDEVCPTLGIIPMTFSACNGIVHLSGKAKSRTYNIFVDLFCACFLISLLIPGWINLADHGYYHSPGLTMLGTYGTTPMMVNFIIHTLLVLGDVKFVCTRKSRVCPHCHGDLRSSGPQHGPYLHISGDETPRSGEPKDSFTSFRSPDEAGRPSSSTDPRPSTDDETARLV